MADMERSSNPTGATPRVIIMRRSFSQRLMKKMYLFLEWPTPVWSLVYHIFLCSACVTLLLIGMINEMPTFGTGNEHFDFWPGPLLIILEIIMNIWIVVDFALRFWSSSCRRCFQGWIGKFRFCFQFLSIIDIITILFGLPILIFGVGKDNLDGAYSYKIEPNYNYDDSSYPFVISEEPASGYNFNQAALYALLVAQILRLFKFARIFGGSRIIFSVMKEQRKALLTVFQLECLGFFVFSFLIYICESGEDVHFRSYSHSFWWSVVTLTTVGYGDMRPIYTTGKVVAGFTSLYACVVFFLPALIIGAGIVRQMKDKRIMRMRCRRPAASLIQSSWRMFKHDRVSRDNIRGTILFMKTLAGRKQFENARKSGGANIASVTSMGISHELICSLESRMILMEKSASTIQAKLDYLLTHKLVH